jgi:hypothetical protein
MKENSQIKIAYIDTGYESSNESNCDNKGICSIEIINDDSKTAIKHGTIIGDLLIQELKKLDVVSPIVYAIKAGNDYIIKVSDLIKGINVAIDLGINILCINMCSTVYNNDLARVLYKAHRMNIILIAPSGNLIENEITYPASLSYVISCSSLDLNGEINKYANCNNYIDYAVSECNISYYLKGINMNEILKFSENDDYDKSEQLKLIKEIALGNFYGTCFAVPKLAALIYYICITYETFDYKKIKAIIDYKFKDNKAHYTFNGVKNEIIKIENISLVKQDKEEILNYNCFEHSDIYHIQLKKKDSKISIDIYDENCNQYNEKLILDVSIYDYDKFKSNNTTSNLHFYNSIEYTKDNREFYYGFLNEGEYFFRISSPERKNILDGLMKIVR